MLITLMREQLMTDKTWTVMNDLSEAFNQITTFSFLLEQLQEAVDSNDRQRIVDTTAALNAFYAPYCTNWDNKFEKAWNHNVLNSQDSYTVLGDK